MPPTQVGFLGTGLMGAPMARRLAAAGHAVTVWNRSPEKAAPLAADGMEAAGNPASAVRGASSVVCMLSSGPVCDEVLLGTDGALAAMTPGATLIVMSSIPVETARAEADAARRHGILYLDAPVSGGVAGAAAGTLAIMAGGSSEAFEAAAPLLRAMGRPVHVGGAGAGALAKLANQMIVAGTIVLVAEAMMLAGEGGVDLMQLRRALEGGFADSVILQRHGERMITGNFVPGGPAKYQIKDSAAALSLAASLGLELPAASLVHDLFTDLVRHGDGELDHSALIRELRRRNDRPVA